MTEQETKDALCAILAMMKEQAVYLHRQHGWIIAVADSVETNPELSEYMKKHPFYDLGPRRDVEITNSVIQNIDALIQKLRG